MNLFDLLSLIFDNLNRRKGRVALTAIGVVIGTAAVVILVSLANGLQRSATTQLAGNTDLTTINVYPKYEDMGPVMVGGGGGMAGPQQVKLLTENFLQEMEALPNVQAVIRKDNLRGMAILKYGRLENYPMVISASVSDVTEMGYQVQAGVSKIEKGTALIGAPVLRQFMDPKLRPGQEPPPEPDLLDQQIKLTIVKYTSEGVEVRKTVTLKVVGILREMRNEGDYSLMVNMEDMRGWNEWIIGKRINRSREGYDNVLVKVTEVDKVIEVTDKITEMGFNAYTPQSMVQGVSNFYTIVQVIFGGVGAVALLVAAIGIANTMTMAILERTREIGLMKAIGATNRDVLSIFLGEAAGIGLVGGMGGVAVGWLVGQAVNVYTLPYLMTQAAQMGTPPPEAAVYTPVWLPVFAVLFATLIGLVSGLYPALRAATLVPVIALKYE